jgi:hypothetical protein
MRLQEYISNTSYNENHFKELNEIKILDPTMIPKKTVKAYKLFIKKGGSLYPLFVNAKDKIPVGKWIEAEVGPMNQTGKVKSKLGPLAFRPGWHSGDMPIATHIGGKSDNKLKAPDYRPDNQVWAEVLVPSDVNWQAEAEKRAKRTKAGKILARTAHITDQIPKGGFYKYKTNPNMTGSWLISGAMKIVRVLSDEEVKRINNKFGVADLPRLKEIKEKEKEKEKLLGFKS